MFDQLKVKGYTSDEIEVSEVDLNPFNSPANNTASITVEDLKSVALLKKLDGITCLGKRLIVRGMTEESKQQATQATAIAIQAL